MVNSLVAGSWRLGWVGVMQYIYIYICVYINQSKAAIRPQQIDLYYISVENKLRASSYNLVHTILSEMCLLSDRIIVADGLLDDILGFNTPKMCG